MGSSYLLRLYVYDMYFMLLNHTFPKKDIAPEKMLVRKQLSFWDVIFMGAMPNTIFRG